MIIIDDLRQIGTAFSKEDQVCSHCQKPGVELILLENEKYLYFHVSCAEEYVRAHARADPSPTASVSPNVAGMSPDGRNFDDDGGVG